MQFRLANLKTRTKVNDFVEFCHISFKGQVKYILSALYFAFAESLWSKNAIYQILQPVVKHSMIYSSLKPNLIAVAMMEHLVHEHLQNFHQCDSFITG